MINGRIVNLGRMGNIAAFGGANYLESEFTIDGTFNVPGVNLGIDYTVNQRASGL